MVLPLERVVSIVSQTSIMREVTTRWNTSGRKKITVPRALFMYVPLHALIVKSIMNIILLRLLSEIELIGKNSTGTAVLRQQ